MVSSVVSVALLIFSSRDASAESLHGHIVASATGFALAATPPARSRGRARRTTVVDHRARSEQLGGHLLEICIGCWNVLEIVDHGLQGSQQLGLEFQAFPYIGLALPLIETCII